MNGGAGRNGSQAAALVLAGMLATGGAMVMAQQPQAGVRYLVELEAQPTAAEAAPVPVQQRLDALMAQLPAPASARLRWLYTGASGWEVVVLEGAGSAPRAQAVMQAFAGLPGVGGVQLDQREGIGPGLLLPRLPPERDGPQ